MGKASSNKKVQRVGRTGGRKSVQRSGGSWLWPSLVTAVVVLGVILIVVSRSENQTSTSVHPGLLSATGDHWHEAYGFFVCDKYSEPLPEKVNSGIHTHGDGLIHVEASQTSETGKNANIAKFVRDYDSGLVVNQNEIKLPDGTTYRDGGKCGNKAANVKVLRWSSLTAKPEVVTQPLDKVLIKDKSMIAFAFVPEGVTPPPPPSEKNLGNPNAGEGGGATPNTPSPGATVTVVPPTDQTAPPTTPAPATP